MFEREMVELVRQAGTVLLGLWPAGVSKKPLDIQIKPDGSQVTNADLLANEILLAGIRRHCPDDAIVSEEGPIEEPATSSTPVWFIDPLDGTTSFIEGRDDFSVLLAKAVGGDLEFGCMFFPARDQSGWAVKGRGAHLNGKRLQVSSRQKLGNRSVNLRNVDVAPSSIVLTPWIDSGLAFLKLCKGELDGVVIRIGRHQVWDIAAPVLMVQEAGGLVTDENLAPIQFRDGKIGYRYVIASNRHVHQELAEMVLGHR